MNRAVYMDYNAGAPVRPEVASAMADALSRPGNPSSVHGFGRAARAAMEQARARVAALVGAEPAGVVFTSGGTEANALALAGCGRSAVLVSAVEHPSVLEGGVSARIPVDGQGLADLDALDRLLAQTRAPALVSLMQANNETGVIQPVAEAARISHAHGALLHCDAAQGAGRIALDIKALGADIVTLSAHKMGGPAGVGALVLADVGFRLAPLLLGGGQERRRRAGTENLMGIVGFGVAAELAKAEVADGSVPDRIRGWRDGLERDAQRMVPVARVAGAGAERLPNTCCLAVPGLAAQTQVMALDLAGVAVSAGSACSSGKVAESHVLAAMGLEPAVRGSAIRISLGWDSRAEDVERFLGAWSDLVRRKGIEVTAAEAAA